MEPIRSCQSVLIDIYCGTEAGSARRMGDAGGFFQPAQTSLKLRRDPVCHRNYGDQFLNMPTRA